MNYFRTQYVCLLLMLAYQVTTYSQIYVVDKIATPPTASNFAYPQSCFVDPPNGHIWVADFDNHRILRFDVSSLTRVSESHALSSPSIYFLNQNYPNPFNSITQITFSVKSTGDAVLTVYNLLGQKIATLFDEVAEANTMYSIEFDAKTLSSGIYLYFLRTVNGNEVKRMCLLK